MEPCEREEEVVFVKQENSERPTVLVLLVPARALIVTVAEFPSSFFPSSPDLSKYVSSLQKFKQSLKVRVLFKLFYS